MSRKVDENGWLNEPIEYAPVKHGQRSEDGRGDRMNVKTAKYVFYMKDGRWNVFDGMMPSPLFDKDKGTITIMCKDVKKFVIIMINEVSWYTWEYEEAK